MVSKVYRSGRYPRPLPTKVYLDANFLLNCRIPQSNFYKPANALFTALMSNSGTTFYVSTLALDEVWWKTPPIAAGKKNLTKQEWVSQMHQFKVHLDAFMNFIKQHQGSGKLKVIGVPADVVDDAYKIMVREKHKGGVMNGLHNFEF